MAFKVRQNELKAFCMRAYYSPIKSLVPPTRFQNPNPNPNPISGRNKRFSGRIGFLDSVLYSDSCFASYIISDEYLSVFHIQFTAFCFYLKTASSATPQVLKQFSHSSYLYSTQSIINTFIHDLISLLILPPIRI